MKRFDLVPNSAGENGEARPQAAVALLEAQLKLNRNDTMEQKRDRIHKAVRDKMNNYPAQDKSSSSIYPSSDPYLDIEGTTDTHVMAKKGGKSFAIPYKDDGTNVNVGEPKEMMPMYVEKKKAKIKETWSDEARAASAAARHKGESVKVNDKKNRFHGRTGTVTQVTGHPSTPTYTVQMHPKGPEPVGARTGVFRGSQLRSASLPTRSERGLGKMSALTRSFHGLKQL